ncbi:hypothetical protein D3C79_920660 [compost metagenome]
MCALWPKRANAGARGPAGMSKSACACSAAVTQPGISSGALALMQAMPWTTAPASFCVMDDCQPWRLRAVRFTSVPPLI